MSDNKQLKGDFVEYWKLDDKLYRRIPKYPKPGVAWEEYSYGSWSPLPLKAHEIIESAWEKGAKVMSKSEVVSKQKLGVWAFQKDGLNTMVLSGRDAILRLMSKIESGELDPDPVKDPEFEEDDTLFRSIFGDDDFCEQPGSSG